MSPVCTGVCTRVCPVYVPVPIFGFYRKNPYIRDIYENVRIMSAKLGTVVKFRHYESIGRLSL